MDKGLIYFVLIFAMLIGASIYQGNTDQITPNVARAQADLAIGAAPVQVIEKGATWVLKLLAGATFTGMIAFAFTESKKIYKTWMRNSQMKRWQPGPNAQWQQQPKSPSLSRTDLLMLALAGKLPDQNRIKAPTWKESDFKRDDDEFHMEF